MTCLVRRMIARRAKSKGKVANSFVWNAEMKQGSRAADGRYNSDLATLVQHNQATALERQNALARLRAYEKEAADLQKSGADNARRVFVVGEIDKLRDVLNPRGHS